VVAVIYSHSHLDHFGGVKGVVSETDVASGKVRVYAPNNVMDALVKENVVIGNAMMRRAAFQFGPLLPRGEKGQVDAGLGKTSVSGSSSLIPPTDTIEKPVETHTIDGIQIVFVNTPDTEAPYASEQVHTSQWAVMMVDLKVCSHPTQSSQRSVVVAAGQKYWS